ncbi:carboxypeptidase N subunit 2 [Trichonephila clavata]|uniref:Carboxypeptidase N subunit 2 n=1 Tax=Trichonephila clavata TaxID=2740835 RepID=A0A8X6FM89_TRICU|nr:carboxypeptidase N subunit 2 [Trichonephila clavata]
MSLNNSLKNAPELKTLLLQSNQFTEIGKNEFLNSPKLKRINLGYNFLTDIHGAFRNLISLESLTISQNRLTTLTRNTFSEQFKLKVIYASGNRWKCDCRFLWLLNSSPSPLHRFLCYSPPRYRNKFLSQLTHLDLASWTDTCDTSCKCTCIAREEKFFVKVDCSNRNLTEVPHELPTEVGELYLQNNLLTNLRDLNIHSLTYLRYLDVEQNNLSNVDLYLPNNLETFKLASNNLTRFMSYFPPSISTWTLSNNPWICDCDAIQFWKLLKSESNKVC